MKIISKNYFKSRVEINSQFFIHHKFMFMRISSKFEVQNWELEVEIVKESMGNEDSKLKSLTR